jgi:dTDP-4-dehydrorhamnose 3,5-epimerase
LYKCSDFYNPDDEYGINWSDSDIGIEWPVKNPIISKKDKNHPNLCDLPPEQLPSKEKGR